MSPRSLLAAGGGAVLLLASTSWLFLNRAQPRPIHEVEIDGQLFDRIEVRANTYTISQQNSAALAVDADQILVGWESRKQQDGDYGVYAQRFGWDGRRRGTETCINLTLPFEQHGAAPLLVRGHALAAWQSLGQDGDSGGCFLRTLDSQREAPIHEHGAGNQSDVVLARARRGLVAVWLDAGPYDRLPQPRFRLFDSEGQPAAASRPVASMPATSVSVAGDQDGFVVAWATADADGQERGIAARRFTGDGHPRGPVFRVGRGRGVEPRVASGHDGRFAVTWMTPVDGVDGVDAPGWNVCAQPFDREGRARGLTITVAAVAPHSWLSGAACAWAPDGRLLVAWNHEQDRRATIRARFVAADGALGNTFRIPRAGTGRQRLAAATGRSCLAFGPGGELAVTWSGDAGLGDDSAVHLTILKPNTGSDANRLASPQDFNLPHEPPQNFPQTGKGAGGGGAPLMKGVDFGFRGLTLQSRMAPPDPHVAAGPRHVILITNEQVAFYTKDGQRTFLAAIRGAGGFWGAQGNIPRLFDPEVAWDPHAKRYLVFANGRSSSVSAGQSYFMLAVSDDDDPNGSWHRYRFDVTALANVGNGAGGIDSPNLGLDQDAIYMTADFPFQGVARHLIFIVDKKPLLSGGQNPKTRSLLMRGTTKWGLPVIWGKAPAMYLLQQLAPFNGSSGKIRLHAITNPLTTPKHVFTDITVPTYNYPGGVYARGTSVRIAPFDSRFWSCVWRNGSLWCCHHINSPVKARWYEIKTLAWPAAGKPLVAQHGTVDLGQSVHTAFNSINVDADGNALMAFTMASPNHYLSIGRVWRKATDPKGTMRPAQIVQANTAAYTIFRWGDYSAVSPDPVEPNTMWYAHEYAPTRNVWSTWVGKKVVAPLATDVPAVSEKGGSVEFTLDNPSHRNKPYILLTSASGTRPGFNIGSLHVPLNPDVLTWFALPLVNTPAFQNFVGVLDNKGLGHATLNLPPLIGLAGAKLHFAYLQDGTKWDFASNPVGIKLVK